MQPTFSIGMLTSSTVGGSIIGSFTSVAVHLPALSVGVLWSSLFNTSGIGTRVVSSMESCPSLECGWSYNSLVSKSMS